MSDTIEEKLQKIEEVVIKIDKTLALVQQDVGQMKTEDIPKILDVQNGHENRLRKVEIKQAQILPIIAGITTGIGILVSAVVGFLMSLFGK